MSRLVEDGDDYHTMKLKSTIALTKEIQLFPWQSHTPQAVLVADGVVANNFHVLDNFMNPDEARLLRDEVQALYSSGVMKDGQIGTNDAGTEGLYRPDMRTDKMVWLEGNECFVGPYMKRHIRRADIFAQRLNILLKAIAPEHAWQGCGRTKIMATCYPQNGARYVAHYDNPNRNGRKLTVILYLNESWQPADGGVLRIKTKQVQADVAPLFNRLLCFWSDRRCPHEVLPTAAHKNRYAITIWYMDEREKSPLPEESVLMTSNGKGV
jgi:hypoxia-inducible factor (prolyl hydroxylase)